MSKNRMQSLILEVLNAQPSLRDSKQYIKSFGPKGVKAPGDPQSAKREAKGKGRQIAPSANFGNPHNAQATQNALQNNKSDLIIDSHAHPDAQIASSSKTKLTDPVIEEQTNHEPAKDGTQAYLDRSTVPVIQQHTALVKIQGPFSKRQLESIADGMVYLKKLGLVSIIVVDGDSWSQPGFASEFDADGNRLDGLEEKEDKELAPWTSREAAETRRSQTRELIRQRQISLRKAMINDVNTLTELLAERGAPARPFLSPLLRVDGKAAKDAENRVPRHFPGSSHDSTSSSVASSTVLEKKTFQHSSAFGYRRMKASQSRSPLVSDDGLATLRAALATDHIPVIAPLALFADPEEGCAERSTPVKADDVMVALARDMASASSEDSMLAEEDVANVDMTPLRLMVINREGGIPSHARGGNPHLAVNLASEYSHILHSFIWNRTHPTGLSNLKMVHDCLSYMPHTSSGIVVSHRSPRSLIANLITNKAAHSPSLPHSLLASRKDVRHTPTIIRPGLPITVIEDFAKVNLPKLTALLEASFKRKLNAEAYYERLRGKCDFVIVTGDYQGAAIVTRESAPEDGPDDEPIAYLDKFAVLPSLQGSGTVDFLWGALRDEVQGLGLLDALNDNGGKGGFGKGRDLVWKSRADNPVNRWYYERSNGFVKVDTTPQELRQEKTTEELERGRNWMMFWCDAEERLSKWSGERRLGATASPEDLLNLMDDDVPPTKFTDYEEAEEDDTRVSPSFSSPFERRLQELDPRPGGGSQRLLPVIAPEESGRLERWSRCMQFIPSAWL
ncbi:unnamed protein product [Sympodiomycopsis kandeliae]